MSRCECQGDCVCAPPRAGRRFLLVGAALAVSVLGPGCGGETVFSNPKGCVYDDAGVSDCDPADASAKDAQAPDVVISSNPKGCLYDGGWDCPDGGSDGSTD